MIEHLAEVHLSFLVFVYTNSETNPLLPDQSIPFGVWLKVVYSDVAYVYCPYYHFSREYKIESQYSRSKRQTKHKR